MPKFFVTVSTSRRTLSRSFSYPKIVASYGSLNPRSSSVIFLRVTSALSSLSAICETLLYSSITMLCNARRSAFGRFETLTAASLSGIVLPLNTTVRVFNILSTACTQRPPETSLKSESIFSSGSLRLCLAASNSLVSQYLKDARYLEASSFFCTATGIFPISRVKKMSVLPRLV